MYGLIGKLKAIPGQRDALTQILLDGAAGMPGCLSYVVAADPTDGDAVWITEVWESRALHQASLALPAVQQAITQGRPLIAGFGERFETTPIGGHGLRLSPRPVSLPRRCDWCIRISALIPPTMSIPWRR